MNQEEATKQPSKFKKILKYTYLSTIHILAIVSIFLMFTALAVKFKWTNQSGNVDVNNRYFAQIAFGTGTRWYFRGGSSCSKRSRYGSPERVRVF